MKDIDKLMLPRYKVIADYPGSQYRIGDIIEIILGQKEKWYCMRTGGGNLIEPMNYPSIFKPLQWWEERSPEDMPEYVKFLYPFSPDIQVKKYSDTYDILAGTKMIIKYEPATESEYLSYKETQSDKTKL